MEKVIAGVGMFEIQPTHKICTMCDNADLELEKNELYCYDSKNIKAYRLTCAHRDACVRIRRMAEKGAL